MNMGHFTVRAQRRKSLRDTMRVVLMLFVLVPLFSIIFGGRCAIRPTRLSRFSWLLKVIKFQVQTCRGSRHPTTRRRSLLLLGLRNFRSVTLAPCQEQNKTERIRQLSCELPLAERLNLSRVLGLDLQPHLSSVPARTSSKRSKAGDSARRSMQVRA